MRNQSKWMHLDEPQQQERACWCLSEIGLNTFSDYIGPYLTSLGYCDTLKRYKHVQVVLEGVL